ncbi:YicC family protein [Myxococcota bacterium]|nr:YicC family protein [Myxococcota bacterium]MCZ7618605.1 YicC family protein [Myxococcota bacterium]
MIRSMTGYGQAFFEVDGAGFEVEARSVNHRHLDVKVRVPRGLSAFENELRVQASEQLVRGKVDVSVRATSGAGLADTVELDLAVAERYLAAARTLRERDGVVGHLEVSALLALPGVARVVERQLEEETVRAALRRALAAALDSLDAMRQAEGAALDRDLRTRLARIEAWVEQVAARSGEVAQSVRDKLRKRAEQLRDETGILDDARLHQEVVWAADRLDVSEECVRLRSHVAQFLALLDGAGAREAAGRRLDFLLQEMGREANTIGSKSADAPIAHQVVELKTELERIREQVQNLE